MNAFGPFVSVCLFLCKLEDIEIAVQHVRFPMDAFAAEKGKISVEICDTVDVQGILFKDERVRDEFLGAPACRKTKPAFRMHMRT